MDDTTMFQMSVQIYFYAETVQEQSRNLDALITMI